MHDVLVIGGLVLDLNEEFDRYPDEGEEVFSPSLSSGIGGTAYNVSRSIQYNRLSPLLVAYVGDDPIGELLERALFHRGIDAYLLKVPGVGTGTVFSVLTPHDRTMFTYRGADSLFSFTEEMVRLARESKAVYISAYTLMGKDDISDVIAFIDKVRGYTTIYFSVAKGVMDKRFSWVCEVAEHVNSICMSKEEYMAIRDYIPNSVEKVITLGKNGAKCIIGDREFFSPQEKVVERGKLTGAGDAFCGGYIAGRVKGLSIEESLNLGNKTAFSWITHKFS